MPWPNTPPRYPSFSADSPRADFDTALPWTVLQVVGLPRLRALLLTVLLLLIGPTLTALDNMLLLTGGGPGSHTLAPTLYRYDLVVNGHDWPQATAAARLLLGLILVVGLAYTAAVGRPARSGGTGHAGNGR